MRFLLNLSPTLRVAAGVLLGALLVACSTPTPPAPSARRRAPAVVAPAPAPKVAPKQASTPRFIRPAPGAAIARFDGHGNKGIDIGGVSGEPIVAAADGTVVYAGSELRSYGNMIILKHNDTFLTAYAHTSVMLVKENDSVRQGQKIAEMGSSEAGRTQLHFEVRRNGVAVDPQPYLDGMPAH
ncbi:MAG: Peptidase [Variovorax sp.]|nr:Peptidase [Variovorax sp.]